MLKMYSINPKVMTKINRVIAISQQRRLNEIKKYTNQKKAEKKANSRIKNRCDKQKTNIKMIGLNLTI